MAFPFIPVALAAGGAFLIHRLISRGDEKPGAEPRPGTIEADKRVAVSAAYGRMKAGTATQAEGAAAILLCRREGWDAEADALIKVYKARWPGAGTGNATLETVVRLTAAAQRPPESPPPSEAASAEIEK